MSDRVRGIQSLLRLTVVGGVVTSLGLGGLGLYLLTRGGPGGDPTTVNIIGWSIKSSNAGLIAIFLAVVLLVLVVRRALSTADVALQSDVPGRSKVGGVKVGEQLHLEDAEAGDVIGVRSEDSGHQAVENVEVLKGAIIKGGKVGDIAGVKRGGKEQDPKQ